MTSTGNGVSRGGQEGSTILSRWRAEREAARAQASAQGPADPVPLSEIKPGTEAYSWLTGSAPGEMAVSERMAMSVGAVYASVALLGGVVGALTIETYRDDENGERHKLKSPYRDLLNLEMHPRFSAPVGWEFGMQALMLLGDMMIRIHRRSSRSPEVKYLEPLHPHSVDPRLVGDRLVYVISQEDGTVVAVDQDDMIHVPGPGFNGRRGMPLIRHALRAPAAVATSLHRQSERILRKGLRPDLVLTTDVNGKKLEPKDVTQLREQWIERYADQDNLAPIVLTGGMGIKEISMKPQDVQLVQMLGLTVEEIARIFGIPPFLIAYTEKTTSWGTGVAQMGTNFVKFSLQGRYLVKIEQEINRKLFKGTNSFAEFNTASLERGDIETRFNAYRTALGRAGERSWMKPSEVRRLENLPPDESFDNATEEPGHAPEPNPAAA